MSEERGGQDFVWNGRRVRRVLMIASIPEFFHLFLGPHIAMLEDLGLEVHVGSSGRPDGVDETRFHDVPFSRGAADLRAHGEVLRTLRRLYRDLAGSDEALVLHVHTPIAAALARLAIPRSMRDRIGVVYVAHGFHFLPGQRNAYSIVEQLLARRTDLFVVMNDDDRTSAEALGRRSAWVPGIGCQRLRLATPDPANRHELAVVGVLETRKRPMLALDAMAHLGSEYTMTFWGSGPLEDELRSRAAELGVADRVAFPGWTTDLTAAYDSAGCLVFTSSQEGLPMAVVEAVGAGLPIVAFPIRGVRDILDGLDSWFEPSSMDASDVATAIERASSTQRDVSAAHRRANMYSVANAVAVHRDAMIDLLTESPRR